MARLDRISKGNTSIKTYGDKTVVRYYQTDIVEFNDLQITLRHGGWKTLTTRNRLNQTSNVYNLGYYVYQKDYQLFVEYKGRLIRWIEPVLILDREEVLC